MVHITGDFSKYEDYPLVNSKFAVYICTYVEAERTLRDMPLLKELKPFALRYDPGCGFGNDDKLNSPREYNAPQIDMENGQIKINFTDYDRMVKALQDTDIKMMYVNAYNPICLQEKGKVEGNIDLGMRSRWNTMPKDMNVWREINRTYAEHFKQVDNNSKYYEIWNEPDLKPIFFTGTMEEYFEIYKYGALGVQEGDPKARIGGPVIANAEVDNPENVDRRDWAEAFLDYVEKEKLPLHFFSYHNYASPDYIVPIMRDALRNRPGMENVETILSEYNSYKPGTRNFTVGGEIERHHLAYRLLEDFKYFVEQSDLTCVYWAQFNDPEVFGDYVDRCGLVSLDGIPKAGYHALKIFSMMPADRVQLISEGENIDGMASVSANKASLVLWNRSKSTVPVDIQLKHLPFSKGKGRVYKIDTWRNSRIDNMTETSFKACREWKWADQQCVITDELLGESVYYVELEKTDKTSLPQLTAAEIKRFYFDRYKSNYAEYDESEGTVYLGMGKETEAISKIELSFDRDIKGIEVLARELSENAKGYIQVKVKKECADGIIETETYDLPFYSYTMKLISSVDVICTRITCTMENMNPHAKVKISLLTTVKETL